MQSSIVYMPCLFGMLVRGGSQGGSSVSFVNENN